MLIDLGLKGSPTPQPEAKYRYEINMAPNKKQLDQIIDRWVDERNTEWDDVGFEFTGKSEVHWLSRATAKDTISLDVTYKNEVVIDEKSLASELGKHRDKLVKLTTE